MARFDWERVVRRCDLPLPTKGVALLLATYADEKGRKVHPGEERLSRVTGINVRNARKHVAKLRDLGLLTRTERSNRLRGKADVYRLTVPLDLSVLGLLDPEEAVRTEPVDNSAHRSSETGNEGDSTGRTGPVEGPEEGALPVSDDATTGLSVTGLPVASDPPSTKYQPSINPEESSSQESTSPGATAGPVDDDESPARRAPRAAEPEECNGGHGGKPGLKADGQPYCAQCRAERRWRAS
jgi:hypothetical protein